MKFAHTKNRVLYRLNSCHNPRGRWSEHTIHGAPHGVLEIKQHRITQYCLNDPGSLPPRYQPRCTINLGSPLTSPKPRNAEPGFGQTRRIHSCSTLCLTAFWARYSVPHAGQKRAYGEVMLTPQPGHASSNLDPSLMQYRSIESIGTARAHFGHKR